MAVDAWWKLVEGGWRMADRKKRMIKCRQKISDDKNSDGKMRMTNADGKSRMTLCR